MGKLSVALLNCQSEAEHRPTFACTEDMVRLLRPPRVELNRHINTPLQVISPLYERSLSPEPR